MKLINEFINENYKKQNNNIIMKKHLLDTAGGVKNALSFFKNNDTALVLNSDIFWKNDNIE